MPKISKLFYKTKSKLRKLLVRQDIQNIEYFLDTIKKLEEELSIHKKFVTAEDIEELILEWEGLLDIDAFSSDRVACDILKMCIGNLNELKIKLIKSTQLDFKPLTYKVLQNTTDLKLKQIVASNIEKLEQAHKYSSKHKKLMEESNCYGCFYCISIFHKTTHIKEWVDLDRDTALCPRCGIDSIIPEKSGYPITGHFLSAMHDYWFEGSKLDCE